MRLTKSRLAFGFFVGVVAVGCGSESKDTSIAESLTACGFPACYVDLVSPCMPEGACVSQSTSTCGGSACPTALATPTGLITNSCYANDVKMLMSIDMSNPRASTTNTVVKKGSTVCYTMTRNSSASPTGNTPVTLTNAAGTAVATTVWDETAQAQIITCTGGSPVVVSSGCMNEHIGASACTRGTCLP